jgi:hypothetical protein
MEITPTGGYSLKIKLNVGMSPTRLQKKLEHIAVAMKVSQVEIKRENRNKFRLYFRQDNSNIFPTMPTELNVNFTPNVISNIPIGIDVDGYPVLLPLFSKTGGKNTLIGGDPGMGKTSLIKLILATLTESNTCVIWFDPKSGSDSFQFRERVNSVCDALDPNGYLQTLEEISRIIHTRNELVAKGFDITVLPRVVLFVDEWAIIGNMGNKQEQQLIQNELRRIVSIGRSSYVSVVLCTQRPTSIINLDVATRELCENRIAFRVGDDHGSMAILGQKGAENKENPLTPGQALVWLNGRLVRTNLYSVPKNLQELTVKTRGLKLTLEDLKEQEIIFKRESRID